MTRPPGIKGEPPPPHPQYQTTKTHLAQGYPNPLAVSHPRYSHGSTYPQLDHPRSSHSNNSTLTGPPQVSGAISALQHTTTTGICRATSREPPPGQSQPTDQVPSHDQTRECLYVPYQMTIPGPHAERHMAISGYNIITGQHQQLTALTLRIIPRPKSR